MSESLASKDPQADAVRQRQNRLNESSPSDAPASLSVDPKKKSAAPKRSVKPPFQNVSMNKFMTNLFLIVFAILAFYIWRVTVWAGEAGGYWALITGHKNVAKAAASAAAASLSATQKAMASPTQGSHNFLKGKNIKGGGAGSGSSGSDVQSKIYDLAVALGVKPADLTAAIRPLIDPTVPNPVEEAKRIKEQMELKQVVAEKEAKAEKDEGGPGLLHLMEEAFLD